MTSEKSCTRCGHIKPAAAFKPRTDNRALLRSECRECENERTLRRYYARRADELVKRRKQNRARLDAMSDPERRALFRERNARRRTTRREYGNAWEARNREKRHAYDKVQSALKTGQLVRPAACQWCGRTDAPRLCAHHKDYSRPLDVEFICDRCHRQHHAEAAA